MAMHPKRTHQLPYTPVRKPESDGLARGEKQVPIINFWLPGARDPKSPWIHTPPTAPPSSNRPWRLADLEEEGEAEEVITDNRPPTACNKAFGTVELLERILIDVDTRTLLLAQRVSRRWNETIQFSLPLQQRLFLRPATYIEIIYLTSGLDRREKSRYMHPEAPGLSVLNPLLGLKGVGQKYTRAEITLHKKVGHHHLARAGSWQGMLFIQPPQDVKFRVPHADNPEQFLDGWFEHTVKAGHNIGSFLVEWMHDHQKLYNDSRELAELDIQFDGNVHYLGG
ncbi:hypothetical protein LTR17_020970 [Elasticomyces elasticus]|nr:hypothetical protein LTR17_020970 [Elasticomyces elasticus]